MQYAPDAIQYIKKLIDDIDKIHQEVQKEKENDENTTPSNSIRSKLEPAGNETYNLNKSKSNNLEQDKTDDKSKKLKPSDSKANLLPKTQNKSGSNDDKFKRSISANFQTKNDTNDDSNGLNKSKKNLKSNNSLGLSMEGKNGINMAIIKDKSGQGENLRGSLEDGGAIKLNNKNDEQVLLRQNYQNLEDLINTLMEKDSEDNYLKLAKLNRLKVLMELSMKMVGRKYKDISKDERNTLDLQANRFHTTYPLPGEEISLEETDENGKKRIRMPLKIVNEDGAAKIDINDKFRIEPSEFIKIYSSKLINHAQDSTGLEVPFLQNLFFLF